MSYTKEELFKHSAELLELIEDIVEYYCDENRISGELLAVLRSNLMIQS